MHVFLPLFAVLLPIFSTTLLALDITTTITAQTPKISCNKQAQCSNGQFCNIKQRVCMPKYSVNAACKHDVECSGDKCYDRICRQPCNSHNDCSLTKEYCTLSNYCLGKHCGLCFRDAECANNHCRVIYCAPVNNCTTELDALQKQL